MLDNLTEKKPISEFCKNLHFFEIKVPTRICSSLSVQINWFFYFIYLYICLFIFEKNSYVKLRQHFTKFKLLQNIRTTKVFEFDSSVVANFASAQVNICVQNRDVEAVEHFLLPLPAPYKVSRFRVCFRFQLLSSKCFCFHKNLTASTSQPNVLWKALPTSQKVKCFRVCFRFQFLSSKCFRFHKNLTASASLVQNYLLFKTLCSSLSLNERLWLCRVHLWIFPNPKTQC